MHLWNNNQLHNTYLASIAQPSLFNVQLSREKKNVAHFLKNFEQFCTIENVYTLIWNEPIEKISRATAWVSIIYIYIHYMGSVWVLIGAESWIAINGATFHFSQRFCEVYRYIHLVCCGKQRRLNSIARHQLASVVSLAAAARTQIEQFNACNQSIDSNFSFSLFMFCIETVDNICMYSRS